MRPFTLQPGPCLHLSQLKPLRYSIRPEWDAGRILPDNSSMCQTDTEWNKGYSRPMTEWNESCAQPFFSTGPKVAHFHHGQVYRRQDPAPNLSSAWKFLPVRMAQCPVLTKQFQCSFTRRHNWYLLQLLFLKTNSHKITVFATSPSTWHNTVHNMLFNLTFLTKKCLLPPVLSTGLLSEMW